MQLQQIAMSEAILRLFRQRGILLHVQVHQLFQQSRERGTPTEGHQELPGKESERFSTENRKV